MNQETQVNAPMLLLLPVIWSDTLYFGLTGEALTEWDLSSSHDCLFHVELFRLRRNTIYISREIFASQNRFKASPKFH